MVYLAAIIDWHSRSFHLSQGGMHTEIRRRYEFHLRKDGTRENTPNIIMLFYNKGIYNEIIVHFQRLTLKFIFGF